jgi:hypothetical protein
MKKFLNEQTAQLFTFVGLFTVWACLEGQLKTVVGWATLATVVIWFATYPLRKDEE